VNRPRWEQQGDRALLRRVDGALAAGARRAGDHLACRVGCTECCFGPFPITRLDARRLAAGLTDLATRDPQAAAAIRARAHEARRLLRREFPGDGEAGRLSEDEAARQRFFARHGALPCPALDPHSGACQLYAARPLSCRTYGPPLRIGRERLPPCRLCFTEASPREVESCRVDVDAEHLEDRLLKRLDRAGVRVGAETIVAYALIEP
jgi:Fe-S-cluster containining protein